MIGVLPLAKNGTKLSCMLLGSNRKRPCLLPIQTLSSLENKARISLSRPLPFGNGKIAGLKPSCSVYRCIPLDVPIQMLPSLLCATLQTRGLIKLRSWPGAPIRCMLPSGLMRLSPPVLPIQIEPSFASIKVCICKLAKPSGLLLSTT